MELGLEGLPEAIGYAFYSGESEVNTINVDGTAQVTLLLTIPSIPKGFSVGEPLRFNVTISKGEVQVQRIPLELEVYGLGVLPVYGDNWLAKMNYTAKTHFVGIPYSFFGRG